MTVNETVKWLREQDNFLILTHVRPDGDTLGSAAALCEALRNLGKTAYLLKNVQTNKLFTEYVEHFWADDDYKFDTVVAVDTAATGLIPANALPLLERGIDLCIDHHPSQEYFSKNTCLYSDMASCGEIIFNIVKELGNVTKTMAIALYVAITTDTGCFIYGSTTANTHRVTAELMDTGMDIAPINRKFFRTKTYTRLKIENMLVAGMDLHYDGKMAVVALSLAMVEETCATEEDLDDLSAFVGILDGVEIAVTLRQQKENQWKLSLRTIPEKVDASAVCAEFGGGGHRAAAGATIIGSLDEVKSKILTAIEKIAPSGGQNA